MASPTPVGAAWNTLACSSDVASLAFTARTLAAGGNLILVSANVRSASGTNFTSLVPSDGTNTYHLLLANADSTATFNSVYYAVPAGPGPWTITLTPSAAGTISGQAIEVTGQDPTTPIPDAAVATHGTSVSGTPVSATSMTTSQAAELLVGLAGWSGTNASTPLSAPTFAPAVTGQANSTPQSATSTHNNSSAISTGTAGAAGSQSFQFTLAGNVTYSCSIVAIAAPSAPPPPSSLKQPSLGLIQRGPTAPPVSQQPILHGAIIEAHWGAQSSQGDSLNNAAQPDTGQPNVRSVTDAHVTSGSLIVTSATAAFNNLDIGALITGTGIPAGNVIAVVNSSTSVTMAGANATATGTTVNVTISGWGQTISPTFINTVNNQLKTVRQYNSANVRIVTDGVTNGSTTLTSASANFTSADVGRYVSGSTLVNGGWITGIISATQATMTTTSRGTGSGLTIQIGQPQTLRLRVECGIHSPNWSYTLGGGGLSVTGGGGVGANTGTVPQWWQSPVLAAYANLVAGLASMQLWTGTGPGPTQSCDLTPEIRECLVGLAMLFFGECFIRFPTDGTPTNSTVLLGAGLTSLKDFNTMTAVLSIHANAFQNTITMADVNPYQNLVGESPAPPANLKGLTFTTRVMDYALDNCSGTSFTNASFDSSSTDNATLYNTMKQYGPFGNDGSFTSGGTPRNNSSAISFQTYPNAGPPGSGQQYGDLPTLISRAASYGATSLEIPAASKLPSGFTVAAYQPLDSSIITDLPLLPTNWPWRTSIGTLVQLIVNDQATSSEKAILTQIGAQLLIVNDQSLSTEVVILFSQFLAPYHVSKTGLFGTQQSTSFKPF